MLLSTTTMCADAAADNNKAFSTASSLCGSATDASNDFAVVTAILSAGFSGISCAEERGACQMRARRFVSGYG